MRQSPVSQSPVSQSPVRQGPARRPAAAVVVALAAVVGLVLLAGCTTVQGLLDTERALERAGYTEVDVGFTSANGFDQVEVSLRPEFTEGRAEDQAEPVAEILWTTFPLRFDLLRIELLGSFDGSATIYTYGEMEELFGPRAPGLDEEELGEDVLRAGVGVAVVLAIGGLLFLAALALTIFLVVRANRRRPPVPPPPWPPVVRPDRDG